jgi:hypothetical protein
MKSIILTIFGLVLLLSVTAGPACTSPKLSTPDNNKTWINPGKIRINNFSSGYHARQKITIHNGSESATTFLAYYRIPDYVENGFAVAPIDAQEWVEIGEESAVLASGETREIEITLNLPKGAQTPERWEFWIGVREKKEGSLTTELCSRWLITMKR